jgi:hypothetical protein
MGQLDEAARETVQAIHALENAIGDARAACTDALEDLQAEAEVLDIDRVALAADLQELEDALTRLAEGLGARVASARTTLSGLGAAVDPVGGPSGEGSASSLLDGEAEGLAAVGVQLREVRPALESVVASAEAACSQALERAAAVEADLLRLGDEAEQLTSVELGTSLTGTREALAEHGERLGTLLVEVCLPRIQRAREDWDEKEAVLRATLDDVFDEMHAHAETLAIEAPLAAQAVLSAAADDAVAWAEECTLALVEVGAAATALASEVEGPETADALAETAAQARAAVERVETVRARWRDAGFGA